MSLLAENIASFLLEQADIVPSKLSNDEGMVYISKTDGSYITRVGMEGEKDLQFFASRGISALQGAGCPVARIGFCESEQKWYGWSHRAIFGFGIGAVIGKGSTGYRPAGEDDFIRSTVEFWTGKNHLNVQGKREVNGEGEAGVQVGWTYSDDIPNEKLRATISGCFTKFPETWGKGEWVAESLEDAKQMATDFAESVG